MDWTCNIGESAIDIVIFSSSNAPLSIFVLGEACEVIAISMRIVSGTDEWIVDEQLWLIDNILSNHNLPSVLLDLLF